MLNNIEWFELVIGPTICIWCIFEPLCHSLGKVSKIPESWSPNLKLICPALCDVQTVSESRLCLLCTVYTIYINIKKE